MTATDSELLRVRLDPELRYAAEHQPNVTYADPFKSRKAFARAMRLSRAIRGQTYTTDRVTIADRSFRVPADGREIGIRGYYPRAAAPAPVLVYLHGAIMAGDLDTEHERCLRFAAEAECVVISVDFRRPPEHQFPAPPEDCFAAVEWVSRTAPEWGGDPARIAVGGSSSGAMLSTVVAMMARDRGGPQLALQLLLYPALDDRLDWESVRRFSPIVAGSVADSRWLWHHYLGDDPAVANSPYAVPARCDDFTGMAPAYVLTAEIDPYRDETIDYATRMMRDGVRVELQQMARTFHGFDAAAPHAAVSARSVREQCAALRWALRSTP